MTRNVGSFSEEAQRLTTSELVLLYHLDTTPIRGAEHFYWTSNVIVGPVLPQACPNPCLVATTTNWDGGGVRVPTISRGATIGAAWALRNFGSGYGRYTGALAVGEYSDVRPRYTGARFPCFAGLHYEINALVAPQGCRVYVGLAFYNSGGTLIGSEVVSSEWVENAGTITDATEMAAYTRIWVKAEAPTGAVTYQPFIRMTGVGGLSGTATDPTVSWSKTFVGQTASYATMPTPYVPPMTSGRVVFQGVTYEPVPVDIEGLEWKGRGTAPRPKLRVSNVGGLLTTLLTTYGDMVGARVTRTMTFRKYLDDQPTASNSRAEQDIWKVERKAVHNAQMIEWELASALDQEGRMIPGRTMMRDYCQQIYRRMNTDNTAFDYTNVTCPYTGSTYFTATNQPTTDMALDKCSKLLTGCRLRFPGDAVLPTWAFPGMDKYRR